MYIFNPAHKQEEIMKIITKSNIVMFILFFAMYCLGFAMCTITITRELEGQNSIMNEQIATLTDAVEARDASLTDLNKQLDTLSEEKMQLEEKVTELQENLDELEKENSEKEEEQETVVQESAPSSNSNVSYQAEPAQTYSYQNDGSCLTPSGGVYYGPTGKETYYNLNMSGVISNAQAQGIQGEYWVREDGVKMYGDYVIVAANLDTHPRGSTVETSLGTGIVLDTGGFAASDPNQVDIAVDW